MWAWKTWPHMTHYINGIYGSDSEGLKVVVVGGYGAPVPDGKDVTGPSAAVYELIDQNGDLRIQRLEILSVSCCALPFCIHQGSIPNNHGRGTQGPCSLGQSHQGIGMPLVGEKWH